MGPAADSTGIIVATICYGKFRQLAIDVNGTAPRQTHYKPYADVRNIDHDSTFVTR